MHEIVIEVHGGIVQAAYGTEPAVVVVFDRDIEMSPELADVGGMTYELGVITTPRDNPLYRCDNCRAIYERSACEEAIDLFERLEPGCTYTDRECPECGALAYPYPGKRNP